MKEVDVMPSLPSVVGKAQSTAEASRHVAPPEWRPIKTAPKDGTVVQVRNPVMKVPVDAKWGDYTSPLGNPSKQWILVKDHDEFWPCAPGALVCPTEWRPL